MACLGIVALSKLFIWLNKVLDYLEDPNKSMSATQWPGTLGNTQCVDVNWPVYATSRCSFLETYEFRLVVIGGWEEPFWAKRHVNSLFCNEPKVGHICHCAF